MEERKEKITEGEKYNRTFENKVAPVLLWIGTIGACITAVAYIITVFILIYGFKAEKVLETTVFAIITALIGVVIMQMLKVQGVSFARDIPEHKELEKLYYNTKTKDKKLHSMKYYWITSGLKDVLLKATMLAGTSIGLIYVIIEGSRDLKLLLLAGENLLMWICFGLLAMKKAYDFYINNQVPYMKAKLEEAREESAKHEMKTEEVEKPQEEIQCLNLETKNLETYKNK